MIAASGFARASSGQILVHQGTIRWLARRRSFLPLAVLLRRQMGDVHVDCLHLLELRWDGAQTVADLITRQWHVLPLNVWDVHKNIVITVYRCDETVTFASAERFDFSLFDGVAHCTIRCGSRSGSARNYWRWKLQVWRTHRNTGHWFCRRRHSNRWGLIISRDLDIVGHFNRSNLQAINNLALKLFFINNTLF